MSQFFFENRGIATLLTHTAGKTNVHGIWVYNNTLSVTNGHTLIRRRFDAPDGFYTLDQFGKLVQAPRIREYPNVEALEQAYLTDPASIIRCKFGRDQRGLALKVAHEARQMDDEQDGIPQRVTWDNGGFWIDKSIPTPGVWEGDTYAYKDPVVERIGEPFCTNLPMPLLFNPEYVIIALTEVARYDEVYLIKSGNPDEPIIIGLNWGSCVMIMPMRGTYQKANYDL